MICKGLVLENNFRLLTLLGKGSFAEVWEAEDIQTHKIVAVKFVNTFHFIEIKSEKEKNMTEEINILK